MSCPSCQVGGRRLPSLPLGYITKTRKHMNFKNIRTGPFLKPFSAGSRGSQHICTHSPPLEDHNGMMEYLAQHPNVVEEYVMKNVLQSQVEKWLIRKSFKKGADRAESPACETNQSLSNWKFCVHKDKRRVLEKLTRDINANKSCDYVINELVKTIAQVIHSSHHNFFLVDDSGLYLTSFSESVSTIQSLTKQEISSADTVVAYVARRKESVFVAEILGDDRFPAGTGRDGLDLSVIGFPLMLENGCLYGVVEFVRDASATPFGNEDMEITLSYMSWCALAVQYSLVAGQINSHAGIEDFIYRFGLLLVEQKKSIQDLLTLVMEFAIKTMQCEQYVLYMFDELRNELYSSVTNMAYKKVGNNGKGLVELRFPAEQGIAGYVLPQTEVFNVKDPYSDPHFSRYIDQSTGITTKSILAISFGQNGKSKGVIELSNKQGGVFNDRDESIMKLCRTYCNLVLAFQDFNMETFVMEKEISVLRDALTYQCKPSKKNLREIECPLIPADCPDNLFSLSFNMYQNCDQFGMWFIKIAKKVFDRCEFRYCDKVLLNFTSTVRNFYHDLSYHNWEHAFSVAQFIACLLESVWDEFKPLERVGMVVAAICHDIDHRGVNNAFLLRTRHPLGNLYSDGSVMECHHSYMTELVMGNQDCDIFFCLEEKEKAEMMSFVRKMILATDLFTHFPRKDKMKALLDSGKFNWQNQSHRKVCSKVLMTISDLCGSCKPWETHRLSSTKVFEEFFAQGEVELKLGFEPLQMFVCREDFPINQVGFLNGIVKPVIDMMEPIIPVLKEVQPVIQDNVSRWEEIIAATEETDNAPNDTRRKIAELRIPDSEMQRKSLSFVLYNCSGQTGNTRGINKRRTSSLQKF